MDCSMPGFPVLHHLPEFAQTHVHWVGDCHPTISSSATLFSFCLQSFPASGSFPMSRLFASGNQSIGASASASVFPMNIHGWFPLGLTGWISLLSKGLLKRLLHHHNSKASILQCSAFFMVQLLHPYISHSLCGSASLTQDCFSSKKSLTPSFSPHPQNHGILKKPSWNWFSIFCPHPSYALLVCPSLYPVNHVYSLKPSLFSIPSDPVLNPYYFIWIMGFSLKVAF